MWDSWLRWELSLHLTSQEHISTSTFWPQAHITRFNQNICKTAVYDCAIVPRSHKESLVVWFPTKSWSWDWPDPKLKGLVWYCCYGWIPVIVEHSGSYHTNHFTYSKKNSALQTNNHSSPFQAQETGTLHDFPWNPCHRRLRRLQVITY